MSADVGRGRPRMYMDDSRITLSVRLEPSPPRLQAGSDRRAIVQRLLDCGGHCTMAEMDSHFNGNVRDKVVAMARLGWLAIHPAAVAPPETFALEGEGPEQQLDNSAEAAEPGE